MSLIIGAVLIIGGLLAAAAFAVGAAALLGLIVHDVVSWRRNDRASSQVSVEQPEWVRSKEDAEGRISLQRGIARAFVILGGAFWGVAVFVGLYSYLQSGMAWALLGAFVPFVATLATLIVGWYYERVTAVMLVLGTAAVVYWGVTYQFELGVWALATVALIGPMMTASVLFWLARREQAQLDIMLASRPELAPALATPESRS